MSASQGSSPRAIDEVANLLASYAVSSEIDIAAGRLDRLRDIVIDTMAVALAALDHPATIAARRYAGPFLSQHAPCTVWGTPHRTNAEVAALANGVLLRCHDYNDLYLGQKSWGHPSDIIPAVWACAEQRGASGQAFLEALAVGYDVTLALFDLLPAASVGWDYSNLTQLAAVCAIARLSGFSMETTREALAIAAISHFASDEIESGDLNDRGDLTMWKRLNAGDAMRQAVYACALAEAGVEGAVRPFEGRDGLLRKLGIEGGFVAKLRERLGTGVRLSGVNSIVLKRWPVGSRAQSAIEACIKLRQQISDTADIASVHVATNEDVYRHLVASRPHAWAPISRETADHSLVYIVGSALLDAAISSDSFTQDKVLDPARRAFLKKIEVAVCPPEEMRSETPQSTIRVVLSGGAVLEEPQAGSAPGARMDGKAIHAKFLESANKHMTEAQAQQAYKALSGLRNERSVSSLAQCLHAGGEGGAKA